MNLRRVNIANTNDLCYATFVRTKACRTNTLSSSQIVILKISFTFEATCGLSLCVSMKNPRYVRRDRKHQNAFFGKCGHHRVSLTCQM